MAFTYDIETDDGKVRLLIDDHDSSNYYFADSEISEFLDMNVGDVRKAAADCCRSLAAKFSKDAFSIGLNRQDLVIDKRQKAKYYMDLAKTLDERADDGLVEYIDTINYEISDSGEDETEYIGDDY